MSFKPGNKKGTERTILMRAETFQQLINLVKLVSLKTAFLMTVLMKNQLGHKPLWIGTYRELADELNIDPRDLRKYSKSFKTSGLLICTKLHTQDAKKPDQYIFTMGPKFHRWLWQSRLFDKIKMDYVHNFETLVDNFSDSKNQRGHGAPPIPAKGGVVPPQRVHGAPPENSISIQFKANLSEKNSLFPFSSSLSMSSVSETGDEINISQGDRKPWGKLAKGDQINQKEHAERVMKQVKESKAKQALAKEALQ